MRLAKQHLAGAVDGGGRNSAVAGVHTSTTGHRVTRATEHVGSLCDSAPLWPVTLPSERLSRTPYLIPNCMMRGAPPLCVMRPNCALVQIQGRVRPQLKLFDRLNDSIRSSRLWVAAEVDEPRYRQVDVPVARPFDAAVLQVAERAWRRRRKRRPVQVVGQRLRAVDVVRHLVRTLPDLAVQRVVERRS